MTIPNSSYLKNSLFSLAAAVILIFAISCEKDGDKIQVLPSHAILGTAKIADELSDNTFTIFLPCN
ncbi:MAG: hypothetical protein LBH25_10805 [Fibromonadaceae bacterium]|jgi:hypothetical protein|nr:hypothetical protein [Fibromonadaceae bacterium]